jgi:hypothetical protein
MTLKMSSGSCCFLVVNQIALCESFRDITDFVSRDVASIISFPFAD